MNKMNTPMTRAHTRSTYLPHQALNLALAAGLLLMIPWTARAAGAVISPSELSEAHRRQLIKEVAIARQQHPRAFVALQQLRAALPTLAKRQRGRQVTVVRPLRSLRQDGLMPMLAEMALSSSPRGALSDRAWLGWRASLLEAVGSLRDARSAPVLWAVLEGQERDELISSAAARALARLGSDTSVVRMIKVLRHGEPHLQRAILPVLGESRRLAAARELAKTLGAAARGSWEERTAISGLGQVGNSGAWRTPAVKRSGEGEQVRRMAAEALIETYPRLSAERRGLALKALLLIASPRTEEMLASKISRAPDAAAALRELARRMAGSLR